MAWLRLIRWKNLLIIFLTQFLAWWCVILPNGPRVLTPVNFLLLSVSTILIAAAGYIINDYFDIKIDLINRPDKVVLTTLIPRKQAIVLHTLLNVVAIIMAGIVAVRVMQPLWLMIQVSCTLLLWFYSTHFKREYVTGNVVVALLTAFTVVVLIIYEPALHTFSIATASSSRLLINPLYILLAYAFFAFMLTWMREIVKDMEDLVGDMEQGCTTMPVKWGITGATRFTQLLGIVVASALSWCSISLVTRGFTLQGNYVALFIVLPLIALIVYLGRDTTPRHFHRLSTLLKWVMVSGIVSLIVYHYVVWAN